MGEMQVRDWLALVRLRAAMGMVAKLGAGKERGT